MFFTDGMTGMEGIQYLRQMNLGEYEVVPPDHAQATHIMNQHGHIEQIKVKFAVRSKRLECY